MIFREFQANFHIPTVGNIDDVTPSFLTVISTVSLSIKSNLRLRPPLVSDQLSVNLPLIATERFSTVLDSAMYN